MGINKVSSYLTVREKPACHPAAVEGLNRRANRPDISSLSVTLSIAACVIHIFLAMYGYNIMLGLSVPTCPYI